MDIFYTLHNRKTSEHQYSCIAASDDSRVGLLSDEMVYMYFHSVYIIVYIQCV